MASAKNQGGKIKDQFVQQAINVVANGVQEAIKNPELRNEVANKAKVIAEKGKSAAAQVKDGADAAAEKHREKKAANKAIKEAAEARKRAILGISSENLKLVGDFVDLYDSNASAGSSLFKCSGLLVFITLGKPAKDDKDYLKPVGMYACVAEDCGAEVRKQAIGLGNPDVYSDFKYLPDSTYVAVRTTSSVEEATKQCELFLSCIDSTESYNAVEAIRKQA